MAQPFENRIQESNEETELTVKRNIMTALLKEHVTVKEVARALGTKPGVIYKKMARLNIDKDYGYLPGEPTYGIVEKERWFEDLLRQRTIPQLATYLNTDVTLIKIRIRKLGFNKVMDKNREYVTFNALLNTYGSMDKAAKALGIFPKTFKVKLELVAPEK